MGFGSYISEVKEVLQECKTVALKRRKASSRLENLGIPEEELLRQQQELFAKVSEATQHLTDEVVIINAVDLLLRKHVRTPRSIPFLVDCYSVQGAIDLLVLFVLQKVRSIRKILFVVIPAI